MPKSTSDAMLDAIAMIKRGWSPARAAAAAGVKRQSIYASAARGTGYTFRKTYLELKELPCYLDAL